MGWSFLVWLDTCLFPCPRRMKDGRNFLPYSSSRGGYGPDFRAWDTKLSMWCASPLLPCREGQLPQGRCKFQPSPTSFGSYLLSFSTLPETSFFFFLMWTIFKVFLEFTRILFLFSFLLFWLRVMWDLGFLTRDWTCTPCIRRWSHAWPCNKPFPAPNSNLTHCVFTLFKRYF